jgi:ABC-type Fe3+-hydroxamate transport system substrate-binding protein
MICTQPGRTARIAMASTALLLTTACGGGDGTETSEPTGDAPATRTITHSAGTT